LDFIALPPDCLFVQVFRTRQRSMCQEPYATHVVALMKRPTSAPNPRFAWSVQQRPHHIEGASPMLGWALTFLVVALIAAVLGFGGIAGVSIEIAKIIFFVAVVLFLISAIVGLVRGRSSSVP
jgi:uncharacterized membrane protein YtjA (UPF0391 family)